MPNAGSFCGNYRVDKDEDCDPGDNVKGDPCCDEECKFKGGANCRYVRVIDRKVVGQTGKVEDRCSPYLSTRLPCHLPTHLFACRSTYITYLYI